MYIHQCRWTRIYLNKIMKATQFITVFLDKTGGCVIEVLDQNLSNLFSILEDKHPSFFKTRGS